MHLNAREVRIASEPQTQDEYSPAESLFMALILQQQKTMKELIAKVSEQKKLK
jgi:hypothetical protein